MRRALIAAQLEPALRQSLQAPRLRLLALEGERPAVDEAREPWVPVKYGPSSPDDWFGVVPATARFERAPGQPAETLALAVKVNPREGMSRSLLPWIIEKAGVRLDRPYADYRAAAEFNRTRDREPHVYRALAPVTPSLQAVLPRCHGEAQDEQTGERALFIEFVDKVAHLDASGATSDLPVAALDDMLRALAGWQAAFWQQEQQLAWAGPRPRTADMVADQPLWQGLLDDARRRFPDIVDDRLWRRRSRLIASLGDWHRVKDALPTTLAHNDFNHRNVGIRPPVLVLDWEIAQANTAQRDLVELLTFALPPSVERERVDHHVETHRAALIAAGITDGTGRDAWQEGFRCELRVEAINRIAHQFLFGALFPLPYLARINAVSERLLDLYD